MALLERSETASRGRIDLVIRQLRGRGGVGVNGGIASLPRRGERLALSFAQERLWLLARLHANPSAYHIPGSIFLNGPLAPAALARAVASLAGRHESLRTVFAVDDGRAWQLTNGPATAFSAIELGRLAPAARQAELRRWAAALARLRFDLARGPTSRAVLLRLAAHEHVLLVGWHHLVADGWSLQVWLEELLGCYLAALEGRPAELEPLAIQPADFAAWQRAQLESGVWQDQLEAWLERLRGAPALIALPTDHPRPALQRLVGAELRRSLGAPLVGGLEGLALRGEATLFSVLLTGFGALLLRCGAGEDLPVGSPVANRRRGELAGMVGCLINTLVLRLRLEGDPSFGAALGRCREVVLAALAHQDFPFEKLVEQLRPERNLSHAPLFQVMLSFEEQGFSPRRVGPLEVRVEEGENGGSKVDLSLRLRLCERALEATWEYDVDLFDATTIARLASGFERLLGAAVETPARRLSELELLSPVERHQLRSEWSGTALEAEDETLAGLFAAQAARSPEAIALGCGDVLLSYGELARRAARLARALRRLGVGAETPVAVCAERGPALVTALLGILEAGGAYIPLDPRYPAERLAFLRDDSGARLVLDDARLAELLAAEDDDAEPLPLLDGDAIAYWIYTSGSTGIPKGVSVRQRSAASLVRWARTAFGADLERTLAATSVCFDLSVFELFAPLAWGGRVELVADALALATAPGRARVTLVNTVPSAIAELVRMGALAPSVRAVCLAGEALRRELVDAVYAAARVERVWNLYGPSEDTTYSTFEIVPRTERAEPAIGRPLPGTRGYVADRHGRLVPLGSLGELWLAGAGLARGYFGRPGLTAGRFVPDGWSATPGERCYRTGDLARHAHDGRLLFLGRADQQVKLRGFRIEPGEIEAALVAHGQVREAVVAVRASAAGDPQLVAWVVAASEPAPSAAELRAGLERHLPKHMVPAFIVPLAVLPRTPNGKVDRAALGRAALPAPETVAETALELPHTEIERVIAEIWARLLGRPRVSIVDDFFALGGHSLLATRVLAQVAAVFEVEIALARFFAAPTVAGLARAVETARRAGEGRSAPPVEPVDRSTALPLSFAQQRLWFLDQLAPGDPAYNMPFAVRLCGRLAVPRLARAFAGLVSRHETLRTRLVARAEGPVQQIDPPWAPPLPVIDLAALGAPARERERERRIVAEAARSFVLEQGSMLRTGLLRTGPEEHVLLLTLHHVIADGWSMGVLMRELGLLYGGEAVLADLPVQYGDFALWQRRWQQGEVLERQLAYWRELLAEVPVLELPLDRPHREAPVQRAGFLETALPTALRAGLETLARRLGATSFMTVLAGFGALCARLGGQHDFAVGAPIANRTRVEIDPLIGFFANTLALRLDLAGDPSFAALVGRVRAVALGAYDHQDVPFEKLVEQMRFERRLGTPPVFQVMLAFQNLPLGALSWPGLELLPLATRPPAAKFDLLLTVTELGSDWQWGLEYNRELLDPATAERWLRHFQTLLGAALAAPERRLGQLAMLTPEERAELVAGGLGGPAFAHLRLDDGFGEQVRLVPEAVALVEPASGLHLSYGELARRAAGLAAGLRARGVDAEQVVGLETARSVERIVALLATLAAGGVCLPLDPEAPPERRALILNEARPRLVLGELPPSPPGGFEPRAAEAGAGEELAYLIYTSGSTGRPKGVAMRHGAIAALLAWQAAETPLGAPVRTVQLTPLVFDVAFQEIFSTLGTGGTLVLAEEALRRDPLALWQLLARERIERLYLPFVGLHQLAEAAAHTPRLAPLRDVITAGEQLHVGPAEIALFERLAGARLHNHYGPSETHVVTALELVGEPALWPRLPAIGGPIAGSDAHLLDGALEPVPPGVAGEIALGGEMVGRGYFGRPAQTAERFVPDPLGGRPGARLYLSGDLGRRSRAGAEIHFLGRRDHQLKIRGFRVEPGEVEAVLRAIPGIAEAVVVGQAQGPGGVRLVAYLVARDARPEPAELCARLAERLAERLPDYLIPASFTWLETLPRTATGKLDRRRLPAPETTVRVFEPPRSELERELARLWCELLGVEQIGLGDDFFALGGHSLLATRLQFRIREQLGAELALAELFRRPTLGALAASLETGRTAVPPALAAAALERSGLASHPLSFAQERLWFLDRLEPGNAAYHLPLAFRARGPLALPALAAALGEIIRRHEVLRSRVVSEAGPPLQVVEAWTPQGLPVIDLEGLGESAAAELARRLRAEARRPFDLARGPLLRCVLFRLAAGDHALLLNLHHLAGDGVSLGILMRELVALYEAHADGRRPALAELPVQYGDFARWQRGWLAGAAVEPQLAWWRARLAGLAPVLALPSDRPRPAVESHRGEVVLAPLDAATSRALESCARAHKTTVFSVLLAVFDALLARWTGCEDLAVGTAVSGRSHPRTEGLIGLFINTVVLRTDLGGAPDSAELIARAQTAVLGAYAHQDLPFERLVEALQPARDLAHAPLVQVLLVHTETAVDTRRVGALELEPIAVKTGAAQLDLALYVSPRAAGQLFAWHYNRDLFDRTTIQRLAAQWPRLAAAMLAAPALPAAALSGWSPAERHQLLVEWNDSAADVASEERLHSAVFRRAAEAPDAVALVCGSTALSRGELARRADALAGVLRRRGAGPGAIVGLGLPRSPELVIAQLAILAAGAAYLPLDPDYPAERLEHMLADAGAEIVLREPSETWVVGAQPGRALAPPAAEDRAYVIYTSGSTGKPKGVEISHRGAVNFLHGMDRALAEVLPRAGAEATWMAVTSVSFDISVLELLWTLGRGFRVAIAGAETAPEVSQLDFSLFYFASDSGQPQGNRYRLLLEGARFADQRGFAAVWTPERHFHAFGGLYPNPALTSAAVAAVTERVAIRAGSVVLPLHDPVRVAEDWSVIDNLSGGRVGVSVATGWHADDFVLAPERYEQRREILLQGLETVHRLWQGGSVRRQGGAGREVEVKIFPPPVQRALPIWYTAAGNPESFELAGSIGANVLTHLLGQSLEALAEKIALYRRARRAAGHDAGRVTLMLHTFVGEDLEQVRALVRGPFREYLRSSTQLLGNLARSLGQELAAHSQEDVEALLDHAFERYFATDALMGTPATCARTLERLRAIGVDEVACLIDFGVDEDAVLQSLETLDALRRQSARPRLARPVASLAEELSRQRATHLQCTPSLAAVLLADPAAAPALARLDAWLLGGEPLPPALAERARALSPAALWNVYGPTETTIWSSVERLRAGEAITIGRPILNTELHVVDRAGRPVPLGAVGELWIGGAGLARGYLRRPALAAERFIPDPWSRRFGARLYRTGDLARRRADGRLEHLGRRDHQVKLRGYRIELGEIEAALAAHPGVREAAVVSRQEPGREPELVAYVVPALLGSAPLRPRVAPAERQRLLSGRASFELPNGMVVTHYDRRQAHELYREVFVDQVYARHGMRYADGDTIFDVGANAGFFTLFASLVCRPARIFAFEPIPSNHQLASVNTALYGCPVELFEHGVADAPGRAEFVFYPRAAGLSGRVFDLEQDRAELRAYARHGLGGVALSDADLEDALAEHLSGERHECRLVTLSDVIREHGVERIDLLKVDAEKSEVLVLEGLRDEDWPKVRQLMLEVHGRELLARTCSILERHGFVLAVDEDLAVEENGAELYNYMVFARRPEDLAAGAAPAGEVSPAQLREHLRARLPEPMVPAVFLTLGALPRTPGGKLDRAALPAPETHRGEHAGARSAAHVAPRTEAEQRLAGLWQELLRVEKVGLEDNFFELGGTSLSLVQAHQQLRQELGVEIALVEMFRHPTVGSLAAFLAGQRKEPAAVVESRERVKKQSEAAETSALRDRQRQFLEQRRQRRRED